jgi:vitamin B12 transporter
LSAGEGEDESVSKTGFGDSPFRTRQRQYAWQNELAFTTGHASHRVTLAVERREERVATDPPFPVTLRTTNAFTAVYAGTIGPHALQANLRDDDSNQYGNRVTGVLAYGYRLTPQWRITASAGTAFKAPTFNDLYFPGFSNPDLRPETARNIEAGGYYAAEVSQVRVEARAVAWHNRVRDLIVFQCDASFDCAPRNVSDATLKGITLGFDAVAPKSSAHVTLDLQSPLDDATGHLLPRRARRHGAVQLLQQAGPATLGAELVASSRRFDDAENLRPLGGYAILNLTAEWPVNASATLFVRADNVFDRNYELAADFSTGGARVFGGVRWRL